MARKEKKYHYIYKTTCLKNNRYYIGMHSTSNLDDGYMGGGTRIKKSIKKYGVDLHQKEILEFLDSRENLVKREISIINEELLKDPLCMNINLGGDGGWLKEWQIKGAKATSNKLWKDPDFIEKMRKVSYKVMTDIWSNPEKRKMMIDKIGDSFRGKKHTEETKRKISEKLSKSQKGEGNSQFGTCWVFNNSLLQNKKIDKKDLQLYLNDGWNRGVKMEYHKK
jgi:hypothetical protein